MKRTLIFQDSENFRNTIDLLEVARRMYGEGAFETFAVSLKGNRKELFGYFHHLICISHGLVDVHDPRGITEILENFHRSYGFDSILVPATDFGRMLAPRLAKRLRTGLVADVTEIRNDGERLELIRPAYSGKILAGITCIGNGPVMMSVRPNVFEYSGEAGLETEIHEYTEPVKKQWALKCLKVEEKEQTYDIRESEVLISGGGGIKRGFPQLYSLAEELNGKVAASRKIVDQGGAPRNIQVGHSGKTVSPRLYMALGINGAMQHVEGLRNVETIISVNTSGNAPICSLSDIVVEGDALDFVEKLTARIKVYRSQGKGE
ncbi:MAG: electron transfer flavoprotein subunit alpha/FixB family protein [Spirochaetaceae bacterium]|jgi:electron transfer flavoprotein alpha subunit|nr:electron transfer flavoprotein subunit alpha/FixB family protein [Spirochaetaceae bacterium]